MLAKFKEGKNLCVDGKTTAVHIQGHVKKCKALLIHTVLVWHQSAVEFAEIWGSNGAADILLQVIYC